MFNKCLMWFCSAISRFTVISPLAGRSVVSWVLSLLLSIAVTAHTEEAIAQVIPHDSLQLAANQGNPWALPEAEDKSQYGQFPGHDTQKKNPVFKQRGYRFVTPEILESLKQQQMLYQQIPGYDQRPGYEQRRARPYQSRPGQLVPTPLMPGLSMKGPSLYQSPMQRSYGLPPDGMSYSNPMYDIPEVSPWGSDSNLLQRGGSFPWMPDAAVGGLPPIHVQPFGDDAFSNSHGFDQAWPEEKTNNQGGVTMPLLPSMQMPLQNAPQNNIFNPFSFGPNGNL